MLRKGSEVEPTAADEVMGVLAVNAGAARIDFVFAVAAFFAGRRLKPLTKSCEVAFEPSVLITVGVLIAAVPLLWPTGAWLICSAGRDGKAAGVAFNEGRLGATSLGLFAA